MKRLSSAVAAAVILAMCWPWAGAGRATAQPEPSGLPFATDHVLVKMAPAASTVSVVGKGSRPVFDRWRRVPIPPGRSAEEMVATLAGRPGVEVASLDHVLKVDPPSGEVLAGGATASPDDEYFPYQWHFPPIQVPEAWADSTGAGVVVAVVDTGISQDGEDLDCHTLVSPYNAITDSPGTAAAEDDNGHGTHVAGTVAQCTDNGVGVAGVAFDASLMPVKVLNADGAGFSSDVAEGIDWAREHGADVINLSLGGTCTAPWPACSTPIVDDALEAAAGEDIVIVAASGNAGQTMVGQPANHPDVVAVGAVDLGLAVTPYSNRGSALSVVAPGGDTTQDANSDGYADGVLQETFVGPDWGYYFFQGTSMATPHVAGAAALIRAAYPEATRPWIVTALETSALDLGDPGFDPVYGHGLIQIEDALEYLASDTTAPSWPGGGSLSASGITGDQLTVSWPAANDDRGVTGYRVYRDGTLVETIEGHSVTFTDLDSATEYEFSVRAVDAAGNQSGALKGAFTTADVTAPQWASGSGGKVVRYSESQLTLSWSEPLDDVGVTGYRLHVNGGGQIETGGAGVTISDLTPGSDYVVEVTARDAAANWSLPLKIGVRTSMSFSDTTNSVFLEDIRWLSGRDITRGCNPPVNDRFCPNDPVTRGQMGAFLVRALGLERSDAFDFVDDDGSVFEADIQTLAAAGITRGCNPPVNDRFCPDDPVTRGQMAAFLVRALGLERSDAFDFVDDDGSVFEADIRALAAAGITRGCNPPVNDRFCPDDPVTRGQMAAFLKRGLGR